MKYSSAILCFIIILLLAAFSVSLASGTPHLINYQGKATDNTGNPVADGIHDVWFLLFTTPTGETYVWTDYASIQTTDGLFNYTLGSDPTSPLADSIFVKYDSLFIGIEFDGETLAPLKPLTSSPYAIRVNSLDGAKGGTVDGSIMLMDTTVGLFYAYLMEDINGSGGGYFAVQRSLGSSGFIVDGNYNATGQPRVQVTGTDRSVVLNMNNSGNNSVSLPADAIGASEILDEPGVGSDNNSNISLTGTPQYLAGRTMTAPVDGYVLIIATAHAIIQHANGTQSSCILDVSDNMTSFVSSTIARLTLPSSLPSGLYEFPLASHALFPISAGSQAYYALGSKTGATTVTVYDIQLTECFFPTAYTTVSAPISPMGSTFESSTSFDPEAERLEAEAFNQNRIESELIKLATQLKQQNDDLNKRLEALENK